MATLDWPAARWAFPASIRWSVQHQGASWSAAYTGQAQRITHLADRWRVTMGMPVARAESAGAREAFVSALARSGDWVRLWHFARPIPLGTMRGSPTAGAALRGATTLTVNTTPGATLLPGDMLGVAGQLVQAAYPGATANGSGTATVPLVMPLRLPLTAGAPVTWRQPDGTFQVVGDFGAEYVAPRVQLGPELTFLEVF
jgi:hypothetical protein